LRLMKKYGDLAQWLLVFRWVGSVVPLAVTHVGSSPGSLRQGYAKKRVSLRISGSVGWYRWYFGIGQRDERRSY
jgi:hypothetical protein